MIQQWIVWNNDPNNVWNNDPNNDSRTIIYIVTSERFGAKSFNLPNDSQISSEVPI